MAISFACPSCEENLKVRDELAGKRVKCPGCGEPVAVPQEQVEEERPRKKQRPAEDDEDDRPRKKNKKQKDNTLLYVGIGGGLLAVLLLIGCGIGAFFYFKGDDKKTADAPKKTEGKKDDGKKDPGKKDPPKVDDRPKGGVARGIDIQDVKFMFKQIGLAYHNYYSEKGRGPAKVQDLMMHLEKNAVYEKALSEGGFIVFIWNVGIPEMVQGSSNTILAYERDHDEKGFRVVLYGDGHVDVIDDVLFQQAPKAQGRK
jgi:hypothetical protein